MADVLEAQVAVVGAGPTGSAVALALQQRGIRDVVLVDSHDFPRDKTCGSGLSPRAIEILGELDVWQKVEHGPSFYDFGSAITGGMSEFRFR